MWRFLGARKNAKIRCVPRITRTRRRRTTTTRRSTNIRQKDVLQAAVWKAHQHTVLCTCAHTSSTWTTPTLTLLYVTLMTYDIAGVRSSTISTSFFLSFFATLEYLGLGLDMSKSLRPWRCQFPWLLWLRRFRGCCNSVALGQHTALTISGSTEKQRGTPVVNTLTPTYP